ncbi:DUF943 family protein [Pantoea alhagi]|uniref:DUF943 family protein n=1 Tax=Pantoea alhagi TaxID=1891675 RepID=UPI00202B9E23|nr:DUF943 family protein [Pantoea alhagi]URQ61474.1 DUF943 family protein [Pantoea alhagi]
MNCRLKCFFIFLFLVSIIAIVGAFFFSLKPIKIIAIHQHLNRSDILVDRYPWSDKGKIEWWEENKVFLQRKYDIPKSDKTGSYSIAIWAFGDGYKALEKYDRLCFDDMPPPKNCIEKDRLMYITLTRDGEVSYWLNNTRYIQKANGELVEVGFN